MSRHYSIVGLPTHSSCLRHQSDKHIPWAINVLKAMAPFLSDDNQRDEWFQFQPVSTVQSNYDLVDKTLSEIIIRKKNRLNQCHPSELDRARIQADKYALVVDAAVPTLFMNRSALKLANLDELCEPPLIPGYTPLVQPIQFASRSPPGLVHHSYFVFFDLCGGPGGFSEYIFWRRERRACCSPFKQRTVGYGVTLTKPANPSSKPPDFRLDRLQSTLPKRNHGGRKEDDYLAEFKTINGANGTGNIYEPDVRRSLYHCAQAEKAQGHYVGLVTADGAIDVAGHENEQEQLMQPLILAQASVALTLLSDGGDLVLKLFDITTNETASLILFVVSCFTQFAIIKPKLSRAANSERYLVCRGFNAHDPITIRCIMHLEAAHQQLRNRGLGYTITLFPPEWLKKFIHFMNYLKQRNHHILKKQSRALSKLIRCYHRPPKQNHQKKIDQEHCIVKCTMDWLQLPYQGNGYRLERLKNFCAMKQYLKQPDRTA